MAKKVFLMVALCGFLNASIALAQDNNETAKPSGAAQSLNELLQNIQQGRVQDGAENKAREAKFKAAKRQQNALLQKMQQQLKREEARSKRLTNTFNKNELRLAEIEALLTERLGSLGELFGAVRQIAGETRAHIDSSIISAQLQGRDDKLAVLAQSRKLPTLKQLNGLWEILTQEMIEQGKAARFSAKILHEDGSTHDETVVRVGPFIATLDGKFLRYLPELQQFEMLPNQPAGRFVDAAEDFSDAQSDEISPAVVDPSLGTLLALLTQTPGLGERISQGGIVGYIIILIALFGLGLAFERIFKLYKAKQSILQQMNDATPRDDNPLGRILSVTKDNKKTSVETLELKLDDAILKEMPALERGLPTVRILAGVAPLLGLLGTVTGMILTFQAITLFGTGDPQIMAGGISQALVTTVLGLTAAIPLLLTHSLASSQSRAIRQILEEQSMGLIAKRSEEGK